MIQLRAKRIPKLACLNAGLYILILILDIFKATAGLSYMQGFICDCLKYASIISCLSICLFAYSHGKERTPFIQAIVFSITLCADFFLIFTPLFVTGVIIFLGAHLCALIRYKPRWSVFAGSGGLTLFICIMIFAPRMLHTDNQLTLLIAACSAYAVLIITVTISTFHASQPLINSLFSRIGMLLFLCCDVNVLLFNISTHDSAAYTISMILMWAFYLPAQTLNAMSAADLSKQKICDTI